MAMRDCKTCGGTGRLVVSRPGTMATAGPCPQCGGNGEVQLAETEPHATPERVRQWALQAAIEYHRTDTNRLGRPLEST